MVVRAVFVTFILILSGMYAGQAHALSWPQAPAVNAKSWVLMDANSGQILSQHDANIELPPASLTKLMTLYLAFEDVRLGRLHLSDKVQVSNRAWKMGGSRMFIEPRLNPTVEELLHGIATLSGNDASVALAEHIAGTEDGFADRMNTKATELGLTHSHFINATGFPADGHFSSAMDMARLGTALWRDFPEEYKLFSEREYSYNNITQSNRNRLLWADPRVDGIKTGHTEAAGYCLVSSAQKDQMRLVAAVFGADSERGREQQSRLLLNYGFRNFVSLRPAQRNLRRQVEIFQGDEKQIWLVPEHSIQVTVPRGYEKRLAFRLSHPEPLIAPISKDEKIGSIDAVLKKTGDSETVLASVNMLAASAVGQASWLGRQLDAIRLWWQSREEDARP